MSIRDVVARRVWDSRGRPTVEVEVHCESGTWGRGIAPAGASRGSAEAVDRRDGGQRLGGWDVSAAVAAVRDVVRPVLLGQDARDQEGIDALLDQLDPTPTRAELGGNVTVATSLAVLHTGAAERAVPVWKQLCAATPIAIPRPEVQVIGGGAHAARAVDVQDFMVVPVSARTFDAALVDVAEVYIAVGRLLTERGHAYGVADEGGHWPTVNDNESALRLLVEGIHRAGLRPGLDVAISLDLAASEFATGTGYRLSRESQELTREDWIGVLQSWCDKYPIIAVEDPAGEHDLVGLADATAQLGKGRLVIGDDAVVTSSTRIADAAAGGRCNAALIKVNQAGTVSAAAAAVRMSREVGWSVVVSARSGETEDVSVAHLALGWGADLVKVGSITRGERTAKWNEMLRIEESLGNLPLAPLPMAP